jgi:hypothetical protein
MPDDLQNLWQSQQPDGFRMPLEVIRAKAMKFQRRVRFRNAREYAASLFAAAFFTWQAIVLADPIRRAGSVLVIAGMLYVVWHLSRWGSSREVTGNTLEFHRRELERQRDLLKSIWRWYLGPMIPGLLVIGAAGLRDKGSAGHTRFVIGYLVALPLFFYGVGLLNKRGARCLQRQIDELDKLK